MHVPKKRGGRALPFDTAMAVCVGYGARLDGHGCTLPQTSELVSLGPGDGIHSTAVWSNSCLSVMTGLCNLPTILRHCPCANTGPQFEKLQKFKCNIDVTVRRRWTGHGTVYP
ncbi:hypothetical protein COCC4DRAFT_129412 [Bipolaris maydis ATCC 48331]|uniref:Uncharacterized protein n=2 Tax=Cochliobolus heterostrophus TaxID=5016 RepID=M2T1P6_COCH5|nr:uncharacterized protein COCC4DRAFT_129412 [Bipolaris maydis ATCC 48331]EMD91530.1 hypothetical protein COCHEDRAFT_1155894 [Bipolaris maydis C5]ENI08712.1 hypothetical protein COCC4DRAFT_129412 [Bipolaris maydis ATCC 48331]